MAGHLTLACEFNASGGKLNAHVESLACSPTQRCEVVVGGRDKRVRYFDITASIESGGEEPAYQKKALKGHSHFVSDVTLSSDGHFALSGAWDATLRLWDLQNGTCTRRFVSHGKDVLSVAFSPDNRQIVSGSRDGTIKLWNTLGECKFTIAEEGHDGWVSAVRFSPNTQNPVIVSCGWDKLVKVWNLSNLKLRTNLIGHTGVVNCVTVSPDGSLCASGGKDGEANLWDLSWVIEALRHAGIEGLADWGLVFCRLPLCFCVHEFSSISLFETNQSIKQSNKQTNKQ